MPFPKNIRTKLLIKSGRRCCVCLRFCGTHIEIDHITPITKGGSNSESNGIPLCFDCHADVHTYNPQHPRGTRYTAAELRQHRDCLFRHIESGGPLVFDQIAKEYFRIENASSAYNGAPAGITRVDLRHDSKVARYRRYIRTAEEAVRGDRFNEAITYFEAAFVIAESNTTLQDYEQGHNYHYAKVKLWQCYLDEANRSDNREYLRSAFNMKMDENAINTILARERDPGRLRCVHYFYLLFQEKQFLFDPQIKGRKSLKARLDRVRQLMDLIEDPHCPERDENLVRRAQDLEAEIKERIVTTGSGIRYSRDLPFRG